MKEFLVILLLVVAAGTVGLLTGVKGTEQAYAGEFEACEAQLRAQLEEYEASLEGLVSRKHVVAWCAKNIWKGLNVPPDVPLENQRDIMREIHEHCDQDLTDFIDWIAQQIADAKAEEK